ncbi:hypothetical protein FG386_000498 [Cryptosporidium ryanae]|uniref:uncharacterized protein n=1 Tax=Cryptosporidium ryanae TaxID=515981 RepID=UPI00351A935E|nr:hypothetical protein FG386_000498 [Cryptosporidium ryanae]
MDRKTNSILSKRCSDIILEYEIQMNSTMSISGDEKKKKNNKYTKLVGSNMKIGSNIVNSIIESSSPYRRDSSLIWISNDEADKNGIIDSLKPFIDDNGVNILPNTCEKYVLVDSYTNVLASNRPQMCYISLLNPLPQDTVVGVKFGEQLCVGKINDTIIEYISPSLKVGRRYAKLYLNSIKVGVKFGNGSTKSEIRDCFPIDVIVQDNKIRKNEFKLNKSSVPVGVMGIDPIPEVDIENEIEDLLILHKPRSTASFISRKHALERYFKNTHSKVVNAPRRETGDFKNLDPAFKAAVNRDFIRRLSNINLEPDCKRTIKMLEEFISKLDIGAINSVIPFHTKLSYWNSVISDGTQQVVDHYHSYIQQEKTNEKSVYIFTKNSPESVNPYHIFMFSCILDETGDQIVPLLRRFSCMPKMINDSRLWYCVGDCKLEKNEMANQFRKIQLPCPVPLTMKSNNSSFIRKNKEKLKNKSKINDQDDESEVQKINKCIQISDNVSLFFEMWPSKLLPTAGNTSDSYSLTVCIDDYQYHSVTGVSQPVLNFIIQKWLVKVPLRMESN